MGEKTAIAWTDHTFNPWWGCERVSPACNNCYAETFAKRTGHDVWGKNSERRRFGSAHWQPPLRWNDRAAAEGRRRRVFCASMADVFEDRVDHAEDRNRLWALIDATPWLDWQLLTKRPQNVHRMVPMTWLGDIGRNVNPLWPDNVWIGTTVEDQRRADERIPHLLDIPAKVRFLSCEPLLGPVDLADAGAFRYGSRRGFESISWVIAGGESGPKRRPLDLDHARTLRDQCRAAGVPFFFKQASGPRPGAPGPADLEACKEFPT